ncbi:MULTISPECIES: hypothetical protein [Burkholderia]|uniref:hypothetical protein n=1 Tax=Burkholderia TaxID=32008 RepID=UPI000753098A|nr:MULTISPECIES: hypothetical protein [Burkholderia]AOJ71024.1 hypothetical protein WS78_19185 [Burkholderia savannae]KVG48912.1 hypothetical protein WS77_04160 [Burkholderia sp. MSMB0265]KVG86373.1 hypothetical protein WS81_30825 [Burkholderia sp. MSMB2040]KVG90650.1 hypothetical protein WS82_18295 [Burkholderia sp. MSMB2041]KVH00304.1 hypothetical protein WS83_24060 [Burkholderia sp. MSMB2042]
MNARLQTQRPSLETAAPHEPAPARAAPENARVLDADFVARLTLLNASARALRGLGYRVFDEDALPRDGGRPTIRIGPSSRAASVDTLRGHANGVSIERRDGRGFACVDFMGVRVMWEVTV